MFKPASKKKQMQLIEQDEGKERRQNAGEEEKGDEKEEEKESGKGPELDGNTEAVVKPPTKRQLKQRQIRVSIDWYCVVETRSLMFVFFESLILSSSSLFFFSLTPAH